mmetsp:Transcript_3256/g.8763  ORF Transcript_3256/g.8763 Transcript_3256/m.8763 type:complete len:82 (+) Transcript_3256:1072-1317(+)
MGVVFDFVCYKCLVSNRDSNVFPLHEKISKKFLSFLFREDVYLGYDCKYHSTNNLIYSPEFIFVHHHVFSISILVPRLDRC